MKKKKYYTYTTPLSEKNLYVVSGYTQFNVHPDHVSLLDLHFEIGDLVEIYNRDIGIIIKLPNLNTIESSFYKVQTKGVVRSYPPLSLKKIKISLDK